MHAYQGPNCSDDLFSPPTCWQYDWEGEVPLWYGLRSDHIDWRYSGWDGAPNKTVTMDYVGDHGNKAEFLAFFMEQVRWRGRFTFEWLPKEAVEATLLALW